jgi:predicted transcriptional regulator
MPKSKRSELHKLFIAFAQREDVVKALAETKGHKRAGLLKKSFEEETKLQISPSFVYRVLQGDLPNPTTVTIGGKPYEIPGVN